MTEQRVHFLLAAIRTVLTHTDERVRTFRGAGNSTVLQVFSELHDDHARRLAALAARGELTELHDGSVLRGLLEDVRDHDRKIAQYVPDSLRTDLPAGFRVLVETAVQAIRGDGIQHLVHPAHGDYAAHAFASRLPLIIIQVPATDPTNALLSPILAHEVAHAHLRDRSESMSDFRASADEILRRLQQRFEPKQSAVDSAHRRIDVWVEELLCDAAATIVTGASMLFALHAHASELPWDQSNGHPPPHFRVRIVLAVLDRLGWTHHLDQIALGVREFSEEYAALPTVQGPAGLAYALAATEALIPEIILRALALNLPALDPDLAMERAAAVASYFDLALIPTELAWSKQIEWEFLLGAWISGLRMEQRPASMSAIPEVARDTQLNALLLKALELTRIKHEWDSL